MRIKNVPLKFRQPRLVKEVEMSIRFDCYIEDAVSDLRKVQYRINLGRIPTIVFEVERPLISEPTIHGACGHVIRFLDEAVRFAVATLIQEACHISHGTGPSDAELARRVAQHAKHLTAKRLRSRVAQSAERGKLTSDIKASYRERLTLIKTYQADYRTRLSHYRRKTRKRSNSFQLTESFLVHDWKPYCLRTFAHLPLLFFVWADRVCQGEYLAKDATLEWLSEDYAISTSVLDRLYLRPRKKAPPPRATTMRFQPEDIRPL